MILPRNLPSLGLFASANRAPRPQLRLRVQAPRRMPRCLTPTTVNVLKCARRAPVIGIQMVAMIHQQLDLAP